MQVKVCNVIEMRDGELYCERKYYDVMSLMGQLGG
jgi:limonene-1,2-epoxide hydrolase